MRLSQEGPAKEGGTGRVPGRTGMPRGLWEHRAGLQQRGEERCRGLLAQRVRVEVG